jgi:hypothetical protein
MQEESGQATIEWAGLVLMGALVLGALAAFRAPQQDRQLGAAVAKRITCATAGACTDAPVAGGRLGAANAPARRVPRPKAMDAFRRLRGVGNLSRRIWIVCLGYRRFAYERDHPRAPTEAMPLAEALDIADACLNPLAFLEDR